MRRPPFRLTVRRLMALVAIVALLLGGGEAVRRRRDFALDQMRYHEVQFNDATYAARAYVDSRPYAQSADYHLAMMTKWRQAARRPWWPFVPDPPPPD